METDANGNAGSHATGIDPVEHPDIHMRELRDRLVDGGDLGRANGQASRWDIPLGIVPTDEIFEAGSGRVVGSEVTGGSGTSDGNRALLGDDPATGPDAVVGDLDKTAAMRRWEELIRARLVAGADDEFDYNTVDFDDTLDGGWQAACKEEQWFEDEPEAWADDAERQLEGETGVQDF